MFEKLAFVGTPAPQHRFQWVDRRLPWAENGAVAWIRLRKQMPIAPDGPPQFPRDDRGQPKGEGSGSLSYGRLRRRLCHPSQFFSVSGGGRRIEPRMTEEGKISIITAVQSACDNIEVTQDGSNTESHQVRYESHLYNYVGWNTVKRSQQNVCFDIKTAGEAH